MESLRTRKVHFRWIVHSVDILLHNANYLWHFSSQAGWHFLNGTAHKFAHDANVFTSHINTHGSRKCWHIARARMSHAIYSNSEHCGKKRSASTWMRFIGRWIVSQLLLCSPVLWLLVRKIGIYAMLHRNRFAHYPPVTGALFNRMLKMYAKRHEKPDYTSMWQPLLWRKSQITIFCCRKKSLQSLLYNQNIYNR